MSENAENRSADACTAGRVLGWLTAIALCAGGAVLGALDANWAGGVAGCLWGAAAGAILGRGLHVLMVLVGTGESAQKSAALVGVLRGGLRLLEAAFLAALLWGLYWLTNVLALVAVHETGQRIEAVTARHGTRAELRTALRQCRVELAMGRARPVRWFLRAEVAELQDVAQDVLDALDGVNPEMGPPRTFRERALVEVWGLLFRLDNRLARRLTDPGLHRIGEVLCEVSQGRMDRCFDEALLLRLRQRCLGCKEKEERAGAR